MRAALLSLLIPAVLGGGLGVTLMSCHREPPAKAAAPGQTRSLTLQTYLADIPKAPVTGEKLETAAPHPEVATAPPRALPVVRVADPGPAPPSEPAFRRYVPAQQAGAPAPDDPRADPGPQPLGFRLTVPICRRAERQGDPLADTPECQDMLQQARAITRMCARAYAEGDDAVAMSPACRQAAMTR
jgi:hypothetical protein